MSRGGTTASRPRLLLVGGGSGLAGRHLLEEFHPTHLIRSVHRHPSAREAELGVEWIPADVARVADWRPLLADVDLVVTVAWYRAGPDRRFRPLAEGLERLIRACEGLGVPRFVHLSVPEATPHIETELPYMVRKREVDRTLAASGLSYSILRPTMLFAPRDVLLTVMLRTMARWHRFPMFGDGEYHVSPVAARDVASIVRRESTLDRRGVVEVGGPTRWRYRDLTDFLFGTLRLPPRYLRMSPRNGVRLARFLETVGSSLLYAYEVEWLVSDRLGLAPYQGLERPLQGVEGFVQSEATRLRPSRPSPPRGGTAT
ncbi:MAG TPA: NAD(P)H-binding protein [Thermoplasmata archaeon]|nr:NAD(P)H-binding protein [Thermoplasmata archaeon]